MSSSSEKICPKCSNRMGIRCVKCYDCGHDYFEDFDYRQELDFNMKETVIKFLKSKYTESDIEKLITEEIIRGNWLDDDWEENADSEEEWYAEYGHNEAQDEIRNQLEIEILRFHPRMSKEKFKQSTGQELYEVIIEVFDILE